MVHAFVMVVCMICFRQVLALVILWVLEKIYNQIPLEIMFLLLKVCRV